MHSTKTRLIMKELVYECIPLQHIFSFPQSWWRNAAIRVASQAIFKQVGQPGGGGGGGVVGGARDGDFATFSASICVTKS